MMDCNFCGNPIHRGSGAQYRAIPGEKDQPEEWTACHTVCGREQQEKGLRITVRWFLSKA
jgi:hypothetical protein